MSKTIYLHLFFLALRFGVQAQPFAAPVADAGKAAPPPSLMNIPDCTDPRDLAVSEVLADGFVLHWEGAPAQPGLVEYRVRHRRTEAESEPWQEQRVLVGLSAKIACAPKGVYAVEVQKICFWRDGSTLHSRWVRYDAVLSADRIPLPPFACGESYDFPTYPCDSASLMAPTADLSVIYIGGIPIELDSFIPPPDSPIYEGQLHWSGFGVATLPFGTSAVRVEFSRVKINADSNICEGEVLGLHDDPSYWPNRNPPPLAFGGAICLPPPSAPAFDSNGIHNVTGLPWDEYGFGPNGTYDREPPYPGYQPGMPFDSTGQYDPNGFDKDGIHVNGTPYNPEGCSREGMTADGEPCDPNIPPYSWMDPANSNPPTQAGLEYYGEIKDSITTWIQNILNGLNDGYAFKRDSQQTVCHAIRDTMRTLVGPGVLDFDPEFIFGPDSIYFTVGMHQHFRTAPSPMLNDMVRNANVKKLEAKHIDLYHCDKRQDSIQVFMDIIADLLGAGLTELRESILDKVKTFSQADVDKYRDNPALFIEWLTIQIRHAVGDYGPPSNGVGFVPVPGAKSGSSAPRYGEPMRRERRPAWSPTPESGYGSALAADLGGPLGDLLLAQALDVRPEDIAFEYKQGFRMVYGVHRAHYMEAISKARRLKLGAFATAHDTLLMPIEIVNRGAEGKRYEVYLDNIVFSPTGHTLDAFIVVETPFDGQKLVFEALGVAFTPAGPVVNPVKIQLANDIHVRINNNARLKLLATEDTYVAFDCSGFAGIGIDAAVELCRNIVVPYYPPTDEILPEPRRVHGQFKTYMASFSDFFVEISMDPFVIPKYEDIKWIISGVAFDMSESVSPGGAPPLGYSTPFAGPGGFMPAWKGFYMDTLLVRLPAVFSKDSTPISIGVEDLVIDNLGVSGSVTASDILSLGEGSAGGWAFSIDHFEFTVIMNQFSRAEFDGNIHVPIFRARSNTSGTLAPSDCMHYSARIDPGNLYSFALQPIDSVYSVDMWKAGEVRLDSTSAVLLRYQNGDFTAVATLNGRVIVDGQLLSNVNLKVPQLKFEGVQVSNKAPYFSAGTWGFPNSIGAKFAGFELVFKDIGMVQTSEGDPALRFQAYLDIGDSTKLKAGGGFKIVGELTDDNGRQRWVYKNFEVEALHINGSFTGVERLEGYAYFFNNDATYGTGFRGGLAARFDKVDVDITVVGQFGRMPEGYKYFMIDALFCGKVPMGALDIVGIGGGVYYHMTRPDGLFGLPVCSGGPVSIPTQIGSSLSGIVYTPDSTKSIGFKFTVAVALPSAPKAFNANATFEMLFHAGGGVDRMWIYGNAKFMEELDLSGLPTFVQNAVPNNNAAINANLRLDFKPGAEFVLDGQLQVYANVAGVLRGVGDGNKVVDASIHFEPGQWHIKIGAPSNRAGMIFSLPGFGQLAEALSYLQIGTNIEGIPDIPADIRALTGGGNIVSPEERLAAVTSGSGFAFGTDLKLGPPKEFAFLIFRAGLSVQLGFDISVLDYGTSAICAGSTEPIGINGWYASGQIYGGLWGHVGIRVRVFGQTKQFNFVTLAAAASMEAKLPNPFWARAAVGVSYNVLGGLVRGDANFQVEIGEQCQIQGVDPFKDLAVVLATYPASEATSVPVVAFPTVTFNFPINERFFFEDLNDNRIEYHITLDSAKLLWHDYVVPTTRKWSSAKHLTLETDFFLPAHDTFTLVVKLHVDSSGVTVDTEERIVTFVTGPGPTTLLPTNVAGSYPLDGQYNFYKKQIADNRGYIQLRRGQPEVFFDKENYVKVLRFRKSGGGCTYQMVQIDSKSYWGKRIEFDLPTAFFENEQIYEMQLLEFPLADPNWGAGFSSPAPCLGAPPPPSGGGNSGGPFGQKIPVSGDNNLPAPPPAPVPVEKVLYSAYFRASAYDKFMEKLEALEAAMSVQNADGDIAGQAARFIPGDPITREFEAPVTLEPFDAYELYGGASLQLVLEEQGSSNWLAMMPKNFIYGGWFPDNNVGISAKPTWDSLNQAVRIVAAGPLLTVTKTHYLSGALPAEYGTVNQRIHFWGGRRVDQDYEAVVNQGTAFLYQHQAQIRDNIDAQYGPSACFGDIKSCIEFFCDYPTSGYSLGFKRLVTDCGLASPSGGPPVYPIQFQYRMPGWDQVTTTRTIQLNVP